MQVFVDVALVVKVRERMVDHREISRMTYGEKEQAEPEAHLCAVNQPVRGREAVCCEDITPPSPSALRYRGDYTRGLASGGCDVVHMQGKFLTT